VLATEAEAKAKRAAEVAEGLARARAAELALAQATEAEASEPAQVLAPDSELGMAPATEFAYRAGHVKESARLSDSATAKPQHWLVL
jgi:hypothetical protein